MLSAADGALVEPPLPRRCTGVNLRGASSHFNSKNELPVVEVCQPRNLTGAVLSPADAAALAGAFRAIADPTRLRLLSLIGAHAGGEACVCDLTGEFDLSGPTISHHLKVLREAGLITGERRGTWIYYRVVQDTLATLSQALCPAAQMPLDQLL